MLPFVNVSKQICAGRREEKIDFDLRLIFYDFVTASFELRAVDRSVLYRLEI